MRFSGVIVGILLVWSASGSTADSLRTEERGGFLFIIHQVDPGETLFGLKRRYNVSVEEITRANNLESSALNVGQIVEIPIGKAKPTSTAQSGKIHEVQAGETLFGIARIYGVTYEDIKRWNNLTDEGLTIGQKLSIGKAPDKPAVEIEPMEKPPFARAQKHYVQVGETLERIASKRNVSTDSLMNWNSLKSNELRIGQCLWYRTYDRVNEPIIIKEAYGKRIEEGIAKLIENIEDTDKYLALHKTLPSGTLLEVRNLMNNKKVFVRVIGQLPDTGLNENVIVRLTEKSFKRLGILDSRARVEITYYDQ